MPNIRRNLHFKLDTSCHHEARGLAGGFASSGGGGCCRFARKNFRARPPPLEMEIFKNFQRTPSEKTSRAFTRRHGIQRARVFYLLFRSLLSNLHFNLRGENSSPLPDFPFLCYISSSGGPLNYEHHSKSRFHRYERIRPFCLLKCLYRTFFSFPFRASLSILDFLVNEIVTV